MMRSVSAGLNALLGRCLPVQTVFAKTDDRTRVLRLSPLSQAAAAVCVAALLGWTAYLTAEKLSGGDIGDDLVAADLQLVDIYEARIARLEDARRRLADQLSVSRAQAHLAAEEAASAHQSLGAALADARALSAAKTSHQQQLTALTAAQADSRALYDALNAELADAAAEKARLAQQLTAANAALTDVAAALDLTAGDRDLAQNAASRLSEEITALRSEFETRRDQQMRLMARLEDAARLSLGSFETVFSKTGVDVDKVLAEVRSEYAGSGGLFHPLAGDLGFIDEADAALDAPEDAAEATRIDALLSDMERISSLRIAADRLPFSRPVGPARFTSGFGGRRDPINGRKSFHAGVDFAAPRGTAIYAAGAGEVVYSARQRGYGHLIKIRHAFGYETVYAHLNRRRVKVGDKVERGDRIGDMGNTGRSTGTHLHYEIRVNGETVNPAKYIEAARNVL